MRANPPPIRGVFRVFRMCSTLYGTRQTQSRTRLRHSRRSIEPCTFASLPGLRRGLMRGALYGAPSAPKRRSRMSPPRAAISPQLPDELEEGRVGAAPRVHPPDAARPEGHRDHEQAAHELVRGLLQGRAVRVAELAQAEAHASAGLGHMQRWRASGHAQSSLPSGYASRTGRRPARVTGFTATDQRLTPTAAASRC
jgi:hypothetical protein